jgi:hypothetical protein
MLNDTTLLVNVPSHDVLARHTYSGGAALDLFGLSAADTLAKLTPSSNPGAAAAILKTDSSGVLQLEGLGLGIAPLNLLHARTNPATTNTVIDVLRLDRTTSGTAANGIGAGIVLYAEDASGNVEEAGRINAVFTTAAHATQAGRVDITAMGAATGVHVLSNGNVGIGTTGPGTSLQVHLPTAATPTVNSLLVSRWTRPQTPSVKWGNAMDILLGSYGTSINSQSRVDFKLADGGTDLPDTTVMTLQGNGNVGIGTTSPSNPLHGATNPATTNTVVDVLRLDRTTSGTAANGIGAGVVLYAEDASGNIEEAGRINAIFTTAAHATQAGRVDITAMGAATGVHVFSNGNVIIGGTTGPYSLLHVAATEGKGIALGNRQDIGNFYIGRTSGGTPGVAGAFGGASGWINFGGLDTAGTNFIAFSVHKAGVWNGEAMRISEFGNVIVGATAAGATATGVLALGGTATAPTTSVDLVHLYGQDISAGNRALAVYQESAVIAAAGIASTHKIPVKWNGTVYYLMASDV